MTEEEKKLLIELDEKNNRLFNENIDLQEELNKLYYSYGYGKSRMLGYKPVHLSLDLLSEARIEERIRRLEATIEKCKIEIDRAKLELEHRELAAEIQREDTNSDP